MTEPHPLIKAYEAWSPRSRDLMTRGKRVFPGGDTRASAHFGPYPLVMQRAEGCHLYDVDGHQLLDFMNNFTSLVHGHAHPETVAAITAQAPLGSAYAAPSETQIELAELLVERIPGIEQMRFCSSGSEGTLMAIRCARAATGRQKIMKMEGGYHGSYEMAEVSLVPLPAERGELAHPESLAVDGSFPDSVLADTIVCPYNQTTLAKQLIAEHADELAAVIVEPMLGSMGMVPARKDFLQALRDATREHGIVLIFDEVITLRRSSGGSQQVLGITPDLTCMGKIIGGGLPVGGVGGLESLMHEFSPEKQNSVMHASTFSGNAMTMAAGMATMAALSGDAIDHINQLGERLRDGFNEVFTQHGWQAQAVGAGSLSNILFTREPVADARDAMDAMMAAGHITRLLHLGMLQRGVCSASRLMYCTSTAMDTVHIDSAVTALSDVLTDLRATVESERPALLV